MKIARTLSLLLAASSLAASAYAATGQGKVTAGQGLPNGADAKALSSGSDVSEGEYVETAPGSALEIRLSNGSTLVLGPSTRVLMKSIQDSSSGVSSYEVVLLRGTLSGKTDGTAGSSFVVRTTGGSANIAPGSKFALDFTQTSLAAGNLSAAVTSGSLSVLPANGVEPITVPANSQVTVGPKITSPQLSPAALALTSRANGTPITNQTATGAGNVVTGTEAAAAGSGAAAGVTAGAVALGVAASSVIVNPAQFTIYNPTQANATIPISSVPASPNGAGQLQ